MLPAQPLACRESTRPSEGALPTPEPLSDESTATEHEARLVCAACGHFVTLPRERISIEGSHEHEFMNPAGLRFRIRCFRTAPGAAEVGEISPVWTWFPGFAWQVAICRRCTTHLGWAYVRDEQRFYGLIDERLRETTESEPPIN